MSERKGGLGRGLAALIPSGPAPSAGSPVDVVIGGSRPGGAALAAVALTGHDVAPAADAQHAAAARMRELGLEHLGVLTFHQHL